MDKQSNQDLKHLQSVLLNMMKEIDRLCRKNNITYYLSGGNALGAIRHNGFIPWDDDFDIMMKSEDYKKFLSVCRKELDPDVWYVQEGGKEWPDCFSKLRLKNTLIEEIGEWSGIPKENRGIFIDIFEIVNSPSSKILKMLQYMGAKLLISFSMLNMGYTADSFIKKFAISCSKIMRNRPIAKLVKKSVFKYNDKATKEYGNFFGTSRFHNAFYDKEVFDKPFYHSFEDIELPLPSKYDIYLTQSFGNYMELPPADKQKPAHSIHVDFGKY